MIYAGVDPGKHTGWAIYDDGTPVEMGEIIVGVDAWEDLYSWLVSHPSLQVIVCEGYRNRPVGMTQGHANTWSENLESQIIGYLRCYSRIARAELILQDPSIKPVGYGYAGLKYVKGKKGQHMNDALAHGMYWWMNVGRKHA